MDKLKSPLLLLLFICAIVTTIIPEYLRHNSDLKYNHMYITPGNQNVAFWEIV